MTDNALAAALAGAVAVTAVAVSAALKRADRNRAISSLTAQTCPQCGQIYGDDVAYTVSVVKYRWVLAPGHSVVSLDLPRVTYLVACPMCWAECEFRDTGQPFVHPQVGVLDFTRTGKPRSSNGRVNACM